MKKTLEIHPSVNFEPSKMKLVEEKNQMKLKRQEGRRKNFINWQQQVTRHKKCQIQKENSC